MPKNKILSINKLVKIISSLKKRNKKIVFTNGCFDILHAGHISYLGKSKNLGDILVIGINSDSSIKAIKGPKRPITPLKDRMEILASLKFVDYVCAFSQKTPLNLIKKIRPDVIVKGADWQGKKIVGADFVKSYKGKVKTITFKKGYSTTKIIGRIMSLCK